MRARIESLAAAFMASTPMIPGAATGAAAPVIPFTITTGCRGAFTEPLVREVSRHAPIPIVMPLSNPGDRAEATAEDVLAWTDGRALVSTCLPALPTAPLALAGTLDTGSDPRCHVDQGWCVLAATDLTVSALRLTGARPAVLIATNTITVDSLDAVRLP